MHTRRQSGISKPKLFEDMLMGQLKARKFGAVDENATDCTGDKRRTPDLLEFSNEQSVIDERPVPVVGVSGDHEVKKTHSMKHHCQICDICFLNQSMLLQHTSAVHVLRTKWETTVNQQTTDEVTADEVKVDDERDHASTDSDEGFEAVSDQLLCYTCGGLFPDQGALAAHCMEIHKDSAPLHQEHRNIYQNHPPLRQDHASIHKHHPPLHEDHTPRKRIYQCSECHKRYDTEELFNEHDCSDSEEGISVISNFHVENLDLNAVDGVLELAEMQQENLNDQRSVHDCEICLVNFASRFALQNHNQFIHGQRTKRNPMSYVKRNENGDWQCRECSLVYQDFKSVKRHLVLRHGANQKSIRFRSPATCQTCGKTFSCISNKNKHERNAHVNRKGLTKAGKLRRKNGLHETSNHDSTVPYKLEQSGSQSPDVMIIRGSTEVSPQNVHDVVVIGKEDDGEDEIEFHVVIEDHSQDKENVDGEDGRNDLENDNGDAAEEVAPAEVKDPSTSTWYCANCNLKFNTRDEIRNHFAATHSRRFKEADADRTRRRALQCDICENWFSHKGNRDKHVRLVHRIGANQSMKHRVSAIVAKVACNFCDKYFSSRSNLSKHVRNEHPDRYQKRTPMKWNEDATEEDRTCPLCQKVFPTLYKKEIHFHNHSRTNKQHKCPECELVFPRIDYMKEHFDKKHGLPKFPCPHCEKRFARRTYLNIHLRVHTGERPYQCPECGKGFSQWSGLNAHKRYHGPKPAATHFCDTCHKGYSYKADLDRHLILHSDKRHICPYCSKAFPTSSQRIVHVRSHTGERPYKCYYCAQAFVTMGGLRRHEKIHQKSDAGNFLCGVCGACYKRQASLDEHIRVCHCETDGAVLESANLDMECEHIEVNAVDLVNDVEEMTEVTEIQVNDDGGEIVEFVVGVDGTLQMQKLPSGLLGRCESVWVDTTDVEKEIVEGILASQETYICSQES